MSCAKSALAGWVGAFADALATGDAKAASGLFAEESYWRDLLAFSWTIRTCEGRAAIGALVADRAARTGAANWYIESATAVEGGVDGWLRFETDLAWCKGHVRLRGGRCWTLLTAARGLKGFEEREGGGRVSAGRRCPKTPTVAAGSSAGSSRRNASATRSSPTS